MLDHKDPHAHERANLQALARHYNRQIETAKRCLSEIDQKLEALGPVGQRPLPFSAAEFAPQTPYEATCAAYSPADMWGGEGELPCGSCGKRLGEHKIVDRSLGVCGPGVAILKTDGYLRCGRCDGPNAPGHDCDAGLRRKVWLKSGAPDGMPRKKRGGK